MKRSETTEHIYSKSETAGLRVHCISSRSYDEDWQRRKSVMLRSLFHDVPILSPVQEESDDSYHYVPTQEASPPRPSSPLPPLIIEKIPITNKHDEPEAYYRKLHTKIKKIYTKLFIENRNTSSVDYDSSDSDSLIDDVNLNGSVENLDFNFPQNNSPDNRKSDSANESTRESSNSTKSNGYGADFESMETEIIDVINYTANKDEIMRYEEDNSRNENFEEDKIRREENSKADDEETSETIESNTEIIDDGESSDGEEFNHSITDDDELTENEQSDETEDEESNNKRIGKRKIIEETRETERFKRIKMIKDDAKLSEKGKSSHFTTDDHEITESETNDEQQSNSIAKTEKKLKSKEYERTASEEGNEFIASNVETMENDVVTSSSSEVSGPDYRQITTTALVHADGIQNAEEKESQVYEDSVKSVILPTRFRRSMIKRHVDVGDRIEILSVLEENADPKTVPTSNRTDESETTTEEIDEMATKTDDTDENIDEVITAQRDTSDEDIQEKITTQLDATDEIIEEMRTPRQDISQGTIPITNRSNSGSNSERTALPQELRVLTSSSQDGDKNNVSELRTSDDMNDILTSIFNESGHKDDAPNSGRKRKLSVDKSVQMCEDKAVQATKVTWDDIRGNFFVGTPKIFRLCACTDHVCQ